MNAAGAVAVGGDTVYVTGGWGSLQIIDVSGPSSPVLRGSVSTAGSPGGFTVLDGKAYVADGYSGGLQVIDVSTPSDPVKIASVDTPGGASDVAVLENTAYVADGTENGVIVHLGGPGIPDLRTLNVAGPQPDSVGGSGCFVGAAGE